MRRPRRLGRRERGFARVYGGYFLGHFGVFASPMRAGYGGHAVYFGGNQQGLFRRQIACLPGRPSTRTYGGGLAVYRGLLRSEHGGADSAVGTRPRTVAGASAVCFYSVSSSKHVRLR